MGYGVGSYGARWGGVAMKKEEDEMGVSFSVRKEEEEEAEEEGVRGAKTGWWSARGDGMEMEMEVDMYID